MTWGDCGTVFARTEMTKQSHLRRLPRRKAPRNDISLNNVHYQPQILFPPSFLYFYIVTRKLFQVST